MKLYFGTIIRGAPVNQGGSLFRLDWDSKTIAREVPIVPVEPRLDHDPNERGNVRGCRGIQVHGDNVIAADYHTLNVFNRDLDLQKTLSHGLMVNLHETQVVGDSIWVTATTLDTAFKYSLADGSLEAEYWPRENPALQKALGIEPLPVDKQADNRAAFLDGKTFRGPSHLHLNAVCEFRGEVYALFHSKCVVANLTRGTIVIQDDNLKHAHNLIMEEPGVVFINDTHRTVVRQYDLASGREIRAYDIRRMPGIRNLVLKSVFKAMKKTGVSFFGNKRKATARPLYLRGLALHEGLIFAGISPATIVCIDRKTGDWVGSYVHSTDMRVCIHGLTAV